MNKYVKYAAASVGIFVVLMTLLFGTIAVGQAFSRYQRVKNARNEQRVIEMKVKQTQMLVEVEKQKAAVRVAEAQGIADSQAIIDSSLSDQYLTYLSIQAQMDFASSDNNTIIYIPVGDNGIPLIRDTSADAPTTTEGDK